MTPADLAIRSDLLDLIDNAALALIQPAPVQTTVAV